MTTATRLNSERLPTPEEGTDSSFAILFKEGVFLMNKDDDKKGRDNRSRQLNPEREEFWKSRGKTKPTRRLPQS